MTGRISPTEKDVNNNSSSSSNNPIMFISTNRDSSPSAEEDYGNDNKSQKDRKRKRIEVEEEKDFSNININNDESGPETGEKRRKRLESNRQSAARSRQRKKEYLSQVEQRNIELEDENRDLKRQNIDYEQRVNVLESEVKDSNKRINELLMLLRSSNKADQINSVQIPLISAPPIEIKNSFQPVLNRSESNIKSELLVQLPPLELINQERRQDYPNILQGSLHAINPTSSSLSSSPTNYSLRFPTLPNPLLDIRIPPETITGRSFQDRCPN